MVTMTCFCCKGAFMFCFCGLFRVHFSRYIIWMGHVGHLGHVGKVGHLGNVGQVGPVGQVGQ